MLIEYLYHKSIGARGGGGGDLHKNRFVLVIAPHLPESWGKYANPFLLHPEITSRYPN